MEGQSINELLEKYLEGMTSLEEEAELREYFTSVENIPEDLEMYRAWFGFFDQEQQKTSQADIYLPKPKSYRWLKAGAITAAVIAGLWVIQPFASEGTENLQGNEEMIENTKGLFMIMGGAAEESKENLKYLNHLDTLQAIDEGRDMNAKNKKR